MASKSRFFVPIERVDEEKRMVYGLATDETKDSHGTIIDIKAVERALPDFMKFANLREMHQPIAAGKVKEAEIIDRGLYIGAKVVDDQAWEKVKEGVYMGFSIGATEDKSLRRYENGTPRLFVDSIHEISLADRPSNPNALIDTFRVFTDNTGGHVDDLDSPEKGGTDMERTKLLEDLKRYAGEVVYDAGMALGALDVIMQLLSMEQAEGEPPEQATALKAAVEALKKFIASEIAEDNEEKTIELAVKTGKVKRVEEIPPDDEPWTELIARKKPSKEDIQLIHDTLARLGAECNKVEEAARVFRITIDDTEKEFQDDAAVRAEILRLDTEVKRLVQENGGFIATFRIEGYDADIAGLAGAKEHLERLVVTAGELDREVKRLKKLAAPPKGVTVTRAFTKEEENGGAGKEPEAEPKDANEALMRVHAAGGVQVLP